MKSLGNLEGLDLSELNEVLVDYYCLVQPHKNNEDTDEKYFVQSMKCMKATLNWFFRKEKGIDIVKDEHFIHANEMFKAVSRAKNQEKK